jgi:hypothetical protein
MPASEQARHHRLRDARGEAGSDRGVRSRPAVGEHLDSHVDSGGGAGRDCGAH